MLTDHDLRELLNFKAEYPILSVYLNTEPEAGNAEAHRLCLRSLLKEVNLPEDVSNVIRYFDLEHDWSGRSVAVFSCTPAGFFKSYSLAVPLQSRVRVNNQPHVKPLANLLDSYGGYGVVVVDKQGARLFYFHLGELREQEGLLGEAVRHTKRGGGSTYRGRRGGIAGQTEYVSEVTERNMRDAVEFSTHFFTENNVRRILIGGTDENVSLFRTMLPKAWQSLVVGTFPASMTASHPEILEKAMLIGREAERQREAILVETLKTEAAKGRAGVIGLDGTLDAVRQGRVQTLLLKAGYRSPGYECQGCGYITVQRMEECPFCGGDYIEIPDAVEMAVRQVMRSGADVDVYEIDQPFIEEANIGALLRY
jgi:peptide subunit release factor 1 (eRF1)